MEAVVLGRRRWMGERLFCCLLLFYAITTVFQLYHGDDMMSEMRRRKPEPTLLLTQGICLTPAPYRHGMRVIHSGGMDCSTAK